MMGAVYLLKDTPVTEKCPFQFDLMNPMTYHERIPFEAFATLREQCPVPI